eukprot:6047875-Alexandrium_andersonii.AAC.1
MQHDWHSPAEELANAKTPALAVVSQGSKPAVRWVHRMPKGFQGGRHVHIASDTEELGIECTPVLLVDAGEQTVGQVHRELPIQGYPGTKLPLQAQHWDVEDLGRRQARGAFEHVKKLRVAVVR